MLATFSMTGFSVLFGLTAENVNFRPWKRGLLEDMHVMRNAHVLNVYYNRWYLLRVAGCPYSASVIIVQGRRDGGLNYEGDERWATLHWKVKPVFELLESSGEE